MNYFVGYGDFDTRWRIADMAPEDGDFVFLVDGGKFDPSLTGLFIVGKMGETAAPVIEQAAMFRVPRVPIPPQLLPEPIQDAKPTENQMAVLRPVRHPIGRELLKIARPYVKSLPSVRGREKKENAQKSPEHQVKEFERRAKSRIGKGDFRDELRAGRATGR